MKKITLVTILCAVVAVTPLTTAQDREERVSRTLDVGADGALSLSNISGDIHVEGTSGTEITIDHEDLIVMHEADLLGMLDSSPVSVTKE